VSDDDLGGTVDEPGWSTGHPAVTVEVGRQTSDRFLYEYVAMPLLEAGADARQISLDPHAAWGDQPTTGVRVGPDGALYQLRSDVKTEVQIARFSLGTQPSPTPTPTRTTPSPVSPSPSASAQVLVTPTAASPTSSARPALASPAASSTHLWVPLLVVVLAVGGIAVWFALWRRRARRPATPADPMPSS